MTELFLYELSAIVTAADKATVEAALTTAIGVDCADAFGVPLSPTGDLPATHYGCYTQARQSDLDAALPLAPPGNPEGRLFFLGPSPYDPSGCVTIDVGDALPEGWAADDPRLRRTWERALADAGLADARAEVPW